MDKYILERLKTQNEVQEQLNELVKTLPKYIKKIEIEDVSPYADNDAYKKDNEIIINFHSSELVITFYDNLQLVLTNSEWADATFRYKED